MSHKNVMSHVYSAIESFEPKNPITIPELIEQIEEKSHDWSRITRYRNDLFNLVQDRLTSASLTVNVELVTGLSWLAMSFLGITVSELQELGKYRNWLDFEEDEETEEEILP